MNNKAGKALAGLCAVAMFALGATIAQAQMSEVKEKAPMYSYVSNWVIPRAQWADVEKNNAADEQILQQAVANGTLVGYGSDQNLVHSPDGFTHDNWWAAMSMAGLFNVLDQIYKSGNAVSPVFVGSTKHWDGVYVSRYYNWRPGSWKDGYVYVAAYTLKADAPHDAVETLSKNLIAPLLEKLLADGTLQEYEVDTQALHSTAPGTFIIVYVCPKAEGLDKVNAALRESMKANPLGGPAFASMVDTSAHRDELARSKGMYK
jgi:hypothetical protein